MKSVTLWLWAQISGDLVDVFELQRKKGGKKRFR